ncbi:MAG: chromosome segregation protein SMC [Hungatella sp.]|nr:chromosome segregation protein SMC [Hungatella sp.]
MTSQRFEALSRICLNNWHYIRHKTLSFHEGINFFTGHSGSGKSTVIDAMQIVLYANTDGRGFFNKAAADDSDRNLIEYLRGMVNIGEDNNFSYLRNHNFSSTIVLELKRTDTGECQCVGVAFDVETASNEIGKMFFWHKGPIPDHEYRTGDKGRPMSTRELKEWLLDNFSKENCYFGSHNERFRKQLYDIYLGGLDSEKFPLLFKRAIPFRMNIKLEEFVKEYICMEQDIHIEDMQQSVMEYGRMRQKIEDTCREIEKLKEICGQHGEVQAVAKKIRAYEYYSRRLDILQGRLKVSECQDKIRVLEDNGKKAIQDMEREQQAINELTEESEELLRRITMTGYDQLREQLEALNALVERLGSSRARWEQTANALKTWEAEDSVSNRTLWDIEAFEQGAITEEELKRLKGDLEEVRKDVEKQRQNAQGELRDLRKKLSQAQEELTQLKAGSKAYPKDLEQARTILQNRLYQETGKSVNVEILADLLEIRDESWRDAVEGYMGSNKLSVIVEPKYARTAMKIYEDMDKEKFYRVAVLDTERVLADRHQVEKGSLAEEVEARSDYAQAFVNFLLGRVMKCGDVDELRKHRVGITRSCVLYHNYRIQHINPSLYTTSAYIGKNSVRQRIKLLEKTLEDLKEAMEPQQAIVKDGDRVLGLKHLDQEIGVYLEWKADMIAYKGKRAEQGRLKAKLEKLLSQNVDQWKKDRQAIQTLCDQKKAVASQLQRKADDLERDQNQEKKNLVTLNEELVEKERNLTADQELEEELKKILSSRTGQRYDQLRDDYLKKAGRAEEKRQQEMNRLVELRTGYLRTWQNRNFSPTAEDNGEYQELLDHLNDERLEEFRVRAAEQARTAVEHFKDDFMYKIRSAIKEALQRKDELNRIISRLDFGKDKYQFFIGKNKGPDGQYYDMFMDEALEINPSELNIGIDNQLNMFTVEHENHYGAMINDLISIFIPPENATADELEEAKRNMDKYADYRTYLSFDMQQLIQNQDEVIKIRLSKMIKKNSGGEGQNPLYVALLASFAQAYKIDLKPGLIRNPTIRLVVLDEAFSKMDGEKVASCIQLIRGLGFQALISATNDKIQNYLETVDKIFVFANPNKKSISIQEFEKVEFGRLREDTEEEE